MKFRQLVFADLRALANICLILAKSLGVPALIQACAAFPTAYVTETPTGTCMGASGISVANVCPMKAAPSDATKPNAAVCDISVSYALPILITHPANGVSKANWGLAIVTHALRENPMQSLELFIAKADRIAIIRNI